MSNSVLEIPKKRPLRQQPARKKSFIGKVAAVVAILALAGLALWKFLPDDDVRALGDNARTLTDDARQTFHAVMDKVLPSGVDAEKDSGATSWTEEQGVGAQTDGQRLPVTNVDPNGAQPGSPGGSASGLAGGTLIGGVGISDKLGGVVVPPAGVTSPVLRTSPEPGTQPDETKAPDKIDKALMGQSSVAASQMTPEQRALLPAVGSSLSENAAPSDAGRNSDSVVTSDFIRDLADWLVACYRPDNGGGRTSASLMAANMRYGSGLSGLRYAGGDPVRGREAVLKYAYTPGMIDALYRLYIDQFMTAMNNAARTLKKPLTGAQQADMFSLYAKQFRRTGAALRGVAALPDLRGEIQVVQRARQGVVQANRAFAETLFAFEAARDAGDSAKMEDLRGKVVASTSATQQAIQTRAEAHKKLSDAIKRDAGGKTPSEDTLLYIAEWVDRRGTNIGAATRMSADIMDRLADNFEDQARRLGGKTDQNSDNSEAAR